MHVHQSVRIELARLLVGLVEVLLLLLGMGGLVRIGQPWMGSRTARSSSSSSSESVQWLEAAGAGASIDGPFRAVDLKREERLDGRIDG